LEEISEDVGFAVILLTPDDVGTSKGNETKLESRARQNVILEFGYFICKLGRERVCAVYAQDVELPSDFDGILYISCDSLGDWHSKLAREFQEAATEIDRANFEGNKERVERDALTGVLNRRVFEETLLAECKHAQARKREPSLDKSSPEKVAVNLLILQECPEPLSSAPVWAEPSQLLLVICLPLIPT
jgi:hypothetical protein